MTRRNLDPQIRDYLAQLRQAAAVLPADRRAELLDEIRAHAEAGLAAGEQPQQIVSELGDPEAVIAEAQSGTQAGAQFPGTDVGVILLLALTLVFTMLAWLAAAVMVLRTSSWTAKQKFIGVVVWPWATYAVNVVLGGGPVPSNATGPFSWFYWVTIPFGALAWTGAVYMYRTHPARVARQRAKQAQGSVLHRSLGDSFTFRR
jgi:hypothetical protein